MTMMPAVSMFFNVAFLLLSLRATSIFSRCIIKAINAFSTTSLSELHGKKLLVDLPCYPWQSTYSPIEEAGDFFETWPIKQPS